MRRHYRLRRQNVRSMSVSRERQREKLVDGKLSKLSLSVRHELQPEQRNKHANASERRRNKQPKRLLLWRNSKGERSNNKQSKSSLQLVQHREQRRHRGTK